MTRGMVIVETRIVPGFKEILMNHQYHTNWPIIIVHGEENETYVKAQARFIKNVGFIKLEKGIKSADDYNRLLTQVSFWHSLHLDKVLIFQHDSMLLRSGIEQYLRFDFIGAPLYHIDYPCMNGGLSLRSTEMMIKICESRPYKPEYGNEDIYFCNLINDFGGTLPSREMAQSFSVETIFNLGSLGIHAMDKWLSPSQCNEILHQYK